MKKVQDIIKSKKALLTNASNEPFVENVCCQEGMGNSVIKYFINEDASISGINESVEILSNIIQDIYEIPKAVSILSMEDTRLIYPKLTNRFSDETIYLCFINYCNYDNDMPVPPKLLPYCIGKPDEHNKYDDLDEKIRKLKREGKNFSEENLQALLKIQNNSNIINIDFPQEQVTEITKIR